jgi:hypothetical protein
MKITRLPYLRITAIVIMLALVAVVAPHKGTNKTGSNAGKLVATVAPVSSRPAILIATPDVAPAMPEQVKRVVTIVAPTKSYVERKPGAMMSENDICETKSYALRDVFPALNTPVANWRELPDTMTVCVYPGLPMEFKMTSKEVTKDRVTWTGSNGVQGASLVICATETLFDGIVVAPGADDFSIHATNDGARVTESFADKQSCGADTVQSAQSIVDSQVASGAQPDASAKTYYFDMFLIYTTGSKAILGKTDAEVLNYYNAIIATANKSFADSLVTNLKFRVLGVAEITDYVGDGKMLTDINALAAGTGAAATPVGVLAAAKRKETGADDVQFCVDGTRDSAGLGWVGSWGSIVGSGVGWSTYAHEAGHNMGCLHDRKTDKIEDTDTDYNFGFMWTGKWKFGSTIMDMTYGTIMSYGGLRLAYWSNPNVTYQYNDGTTTSPVPLGVPVGTVKAAYNAKVIQDAAPKISAWNVNVNGPIITTQPKSAAAYYGDGFAVSVTATGANLTYQWKKDGTAITGATTATYTVASSIAADSGSYVVDLANDTDSVTSSAAAVTLSQKPVPPVPTPPASPSSSSGGGGGAPSDWFFGALIALTLTRKALRSRKAA